MPLSCFMCQPWTVDTGRPDPDAILRGIQDEQPGRGRLKVFLGSSAGVGKTYAMLSEAHGLRAKGRSVLVGIVETHGRVDTSELLNGLPVLPRKVISYRGIDIEEFDLDAAIEQRPDLILVDELAHTNAPGSRHTKRWQDVEELLSAGIDVHTTVNIQHLESLVDSVAQITGIIVRETVPDRIMELASEIELVDIPPEELRQRLREGKVYVAEKVEHALEGFFQTSNLLALRELALRRTADRVEADIQRIRSGQANSAVWTARDRILVCVGPHPLATKVVRSAARHAAMSHAVVTVVFVETDRQRHLSEQAFLQVREAFRLADELGMTTVRLCGHDAVQEVLTYARRNDFNLLMVGKPLKPRWREWLQGSFVDELVRRSGEIDVHVITGESPGARPEVTHARPVSWGTRRGHTESLVAVIVASLLCWPVSSTIDPTNLAMAYLLAIAWVASRFSPAEAVSVSIVSVLAFDLLWVPPQGTFAVSDTQYVITFLVMLVVGLLISSLSLKLRRESRETADRERRASALFSLTRQLAMSRSKLEIANVAATEIGQVFESEVAVLIGMDGLNPTRPSPSRFEEEPAEAAVAAWCHRESAPAGNSTDTLGGARGLYLPLRGSRQATGVLAILPNPQQWPLTPVQQHLLETFANSVGLALERAFLAKESQDARISAESERLRNALLSSISHDLRTPLTSIAGAASALVQNGGGELAETIYSESMRLNAQVQNLLDMTRLQSGEINLDLQWHVLEEVIGAAISRNRDLLGGHPVSVSIPAGFPLLQIDAFLFDKLFSNLLENAATYTPRGTAIEITALDQTDILRIIVRDHGPGIPAGEEAAVFERFAQGGEKGKGLGLGLAICRAIVGMHRGRIWVRNSKEGGAEFHIELPRPTSQPEVPIG